MLRRVIAGLFLAGLAIGVWLLWPEGQDAGPTTTAAIASDATTTGETVAPTTSPADTSTSTTVSAEDHVVETVEEAEDILRDLWFGWFEGIYNEDEDRIREVVATAHQLELATSQFGEMEFGAAPRSNDFTYVNTEILRSDTECLVVSTTALIDGFTSAETTDVHVLRWTQSRWKFFSLWSFIGDLWENDCEALLES